MESDKMSSHDENGHHANNIVHDNHVNQTGSPEFSHEFVSQPPVKLTLDEHDQEQQKLQPSQPQPQILHPLENESVQLPQNSTITIPDQLSQQSTPQKSITKVQLSNELNILDWIRTTDIMSKVAERAKSSMDSVITALDPGMKEYLYSGGSINIMVIADHDRLVNPVRDAFLSAFGRATVTQARIGSPDLVPSYPMKLARGIEGSREVARDRIRALRVETNTVPQNQVMVVIQPSLVSFPTTSPTNNGPDQVEGSLTCSWFLTYNCYLDDPVLNLSIDSLSQFVPIDSDLVAIAESVKGPDELNKSRSGFFISIDELMSNKLGLVPQSRNDEESSIWLERWSSLDDVDIVRNLSLSLAHSYQRKWNDCVILSSR